MAKFKDGGSGFIIKALKNPIIIKNRQETRYILGLILTPGHVCVILLHSSQQVTPFNAKLTDLNQIQFS